MKIEDNSFADTLGEIAENMAKSDGFVMIPMTLIEHENDEGLYGIDTSVQFYERLQMEDGDETLLHMFMSALASLMQTCFERFDNEKVSGVIYTTLNERMSLVEVNKTKH